MLAWLPGRFSEQVLLVAVLGLCLIEGLGLFASHALMLCKYLILLKLPFLMPNQRQSPAKRSMHAESNQRHWWSYSSGKY